MRSDIDWLHIPRLDVQLWAVEVIEDGARRLHSLFTSKGAAIIKAEELTRRDFDTVQVRGVVHSEPIALRRASPVYEITSGFRDWTKVVE